MNIKSVPPTTRRVSLHTDQLVNDKIKLKTLKNLFAYEGCSSRIISERIRKLNSEWDTERVLEANAAILALIGTVLGLRRNKFWFILPGAVGVFLLQHAVQGWCPPVPLLRRLGVRTAEEIHNEKTVLKVMRSDIPQCSYDVTKVLRAVELD
jgi:hypothetical protein